MAFPEICSQAESAVRLFVQGDVLRAFQPNDVLAFGFVFVIATCLSILQEGQAHFLAGRAQGFDVFDLCFDFSEVTHGSLVFLEIRGRANEAASNGTNFE